MNTIKSWGLALILTAAVLAPSTARAAALECDQLSTGMRICLPRYGTDFDQWAMSDIAALSIINSSAVVNSTTSASSSAWLMTKRITGLYPAYADGIWISSATTFTSSATFAGGGGLAVTYGVSAGTVSIPTIGNKISFDNPRRAIFVDPAGANPITITNHAAAGKIAQFALDYDDSNADVGMNAVAYIDGTGVVSKYGVSAATGSFSGSVTASSVTVLGNIQIPDGSSYKNNTYSGTFVRQSNDLTLGANRNILLEGGHVALNTGITASSATFKEPTGGKTTVKPINNGQSVVHDYENGNTAGFGMNAGGAGYCGALFHSGSARATWCNNGGLALGSYAAATNAPANTLIVDSVGIGHSAPASKLHMSSGTLLLDGTAPLIKIATLGNRQPLFIDGGTETGYVAANITNNGGAVYLGVDNSVGSIFSAGAYGSFFGSGSARPACIMTDSVCRLNVAQTTGNIGIGTASPVTTLDVNGNAQFGTTGKSTFSTTGILTSPGVTTDNASPSGHIFNRNGTTYGTIDTASNHLSVTLYNSASLDVTGGNMGVGTTAPCSTCTLHVAGGASVTGAFQVGGSSGTRIDDHGHVYYRGPTPTATSCGTSPSISGTDSAGKVTTGSPGATSCTVNFASAWDTAPTCVVGSQATAGISGNAVGVQSVSTTQLVMAFPITFGGVQIPWICFGKE